MRRIALLASLILLDCILGCQKKPGETGNSKADSLIQVARELINSENYDSARQTLQLASNEVGPSQKLGLAEEIDYLADESKTDEILINLSDTEYEQLLENKLKKKFFFIKDTLIETKINEKLYKKRLTRNKTYEEQLNTKLKEAEASGKVKRQQQKENRRSYASILQDTYYEKGMNVKVTVSGKNHEKLKLEYALINEVWGTILGKEN